MHVILFLAFALFSAVSFAQASPGISPKISQLQKQKQELRVRKSRRVVTEEKAKLQLLMYLLNEGRYSEKDQAQEFKLQRPSNYAFGLRYDKISAYIESSRFEEVTGQGYYSVERQRKSHLLWGNYDVYQFADTVYFPIGLGLGVYNETVITKVQDIEERNNSEYQWNSGLSVGAELRYKFVSFKTEAQLIYANNQKPNPTWAAFARLGLILF